MQLKPDKEIYKETVEESGNYKDSLYKLKDLHRALIHIIEKIKIKSDELETVEEDIDNILYDINANDRKVKENEAKLTTFMELLKLSDYEQIKTEIDDCIRLMAEIPNSITAEVRKSERLKSEFEQIKNKLEVIDSDIQLKEKLTNVCAESFKNEYMLGYVLLIQEEEDILKAAKGVIKELKTEEKTYKSKDEYVSAIYNKFNENTQYLREYMVKIETIFDTEEGTDFIEITNALSKRRRLNLTGKVRGRDVSFYDLISFIEEGVDENEKLLKESDRQLFEDILVKNISKKIRAKIYHSQKWVDKMNELMKAMAMYVPLFSAVYARYEGASKNCPRMISLDEAFAGVDEKNIRDKYVSLGSFGGSITLTNLTQEEKEILSGFFGKDYYKKSATIKLEKFQRRLLDTRFSGVNFEEVMHLYFNGKLITKHEERNTYQREREGFVSDFKNKYNSTRAGLWIEYVFESGKNAYNIINRRYNQDRDSLKRDLELTCEGINALPFDDYHERLAIFASRVSKNPHAFDDNSECGKLLVYALGYFLEMGYPADAEERAELLYRAGIIKDEVSNFTVCCGLLASESDKIHEGWKGFYEQGEPLQVSIWNLSKLDRIWTDKNKIFVFENPTVFSEVLCQTSKRKIPLLCTNGQVKLASLIVLDYLAEQGVTIFYSGDFDPEGLMIADRLKLRYGEQLFLWRYNEEDYTRIKSKEVIDSIRMKKLSNLRDERLIEIGKVILQHGCAGYQELLIDMYAEDILNRWM